LDINIVRLLKSDSKVTEKMKRQKEVGTNIGVPNL